MWCSTEQRERVFAISIRKDIDKATFEFPIPFDNGLRLKDMLEDVVDEKYFLSNFVQSRFQLTDYKQPKQICDTNDCIQSHTLKGGKWDKIYESCRRVYSEQGCSPTITTCGGGNTEPKVSIEDKTYIDNIDDKYQYVKKKSAEMLNEKGYLPSIYNPYNKSEITDFAPTQTSRVDKVGTSGAVLIKQPNYTIRKLTPVECYRLMGFGDELIHKVKAIGMSDAQMYKQAGNSIVTNCIRLIMEHLYKAQVDSGYICSDENFTKLSPLKYEMITQP